MGFTKLNVLLLTNMGESEVQPASGLFVRRQFKALKDINYSNLNLSYFELPKKH